MHWPRRVDWVESKENGSLPHREVFRQISLPPELAAKIEREANARGMSVPDFVRETLENALVQMPSDDPLFADTAVYRDEGPSDFASNHDDYLYGDAS